MEVLFRFVCILSQISNKATKLVISQDFTEHKWALFMIGNMRFLKNSFITNDKAT